MTGKGEVVGAEFVRNRDVAEVSFTGSSGVGESIVRDGAATMKRVTLELGGKSPDILLDDVVLARAIPTALGIAFMNSGQACAAGTRLRSRAVSSKPSSAPSSRPRPRFASAILPIRNPSSDRW